MSRARVTVVRDHKLRAYLGRVHCALSQRVLALTLPHTDRNEATRAALALARTL